MNKTELNKVMQKANELKGSDIDLGAAAEPCAGIALKNFNDGMGKKPVSLLAAAALVRYQAMQFNGEWNQEELSDTLWLLGKRTTLID